MTREEFYKLTDILNSEVLGNFMHGGEADELIAMFEEAVEHSNILEQEKPVSDELGEYINELSKQFPEVSFAKLSRIAVRVVKWQKQRNNIPQELIDAYCEFQKVGGDSVRVVINAINAIKEKQL